MHTYIPVFLYSLYCVFCTQPWAHGTFSCLYFLDVDGSTFLCHCTLYVCVGGGEGVEGLFLLLYEIADFFLNE